MNFLDREAVERHASVIMVTYHDCRIVLYLLLYHIHPFIHYMMTVRDELL